MEINIQNPSAALFDQIAQAFADSFDKPDSAQIRRFYDELVRFEQLARRQKDEWLQILPLVKMMNAKVAYAFGRKHVDAEFYNMFTLLIRQVEEPAHLTNLKLFIEATIGFRKLRGSDKKENRA